MSRLNLSAFLKSVLLLAGGAAIAQGITVGVTPILTRLYSPEEFGMLAAFVSALAIFSVAASLRLEFALPQIENDRTAKLLVWVCLFLICLVGVGAGFLVFIFSILNSENGLSWDVIWFFPLGLFFVGAFQVANYWAIREKDFKTLAKANVDRSLFQAITQLVLGGVGLGGGGLIVGYLVGQALGASKLLVKVFSGRKRISIWRSVVVVFSYKRFPAYSMPAGILNASAIHVTPFLIIYMYGSASAGFFSLAQRAMGAPMAFLGMAIGSVFLSELAEKKNKHPEQLFRFYCVACRNLILIGFPIVAVATIVLWFGVEFIFGEQWAESALFALYLSPLFLGQFVVSPLSQTLVVIGRQDVQLIWDVLRLFLPNVALFLACMFGMDSIQAVGVYGVAMAIVYVVNVLVTIFFLHRMRSH